MPDIKIGFQQLLNVFKEVLTTALPRVERPDDFPQTLRGSQRQILDPARYLLAFILNIVKVAGKLSQKPHLPHELIQIKSHCELKWEETSFETNTWKD